MSATTLQRFAYFPTSSPDCSESLYKSELSAELSLVLADDHLYAAYLCWSSLHLENVVLFTVRLNHDNLA